MNRKRGLGRGLDALLSSDGHFAAEDSAALDEIGIEQIHRGRYQPRQRMDDESLGELAASIRAQGVMQPIVVRHRAAGGYEIIAGERRWRATQLAGLDRIPAVVRDVSDESAVAMALIENIQREDLNPLEEATALKRLQEEFDLSQQQVADAVGKSRVAVTNTLRLLNLSGAVREMLAHGELEMGHARALLSLDGERQERAAREVIARRLSVRQTEALARKLQAGEVRPSAPAKDPDTRRLETRLSEQLGASVTITDNGRGKGQLTIRYSSMDELDGILARIR